MNPKQITCARCRKPVESTSWWDDHTTRERVLQARCHGAVDEMRFRPDRLTPEQDGDAYPDWLTTTPEDAVAENLSYWTDDE